MNLSTSIHLRDGSGFLSYRDTGKHATRWCAMIDLKGRKAQVYGFGRTDLSCLKDLQANIDRAMEGGVRI